jgi:hypothetical protein
MNETPSELTTTGQRFKYWIEKILKESIREFAGNVEVGDYRTIYSIVNDKSRFTPKTVRKVIDKYPSFPGDWIMTGEGKAPTNTVAGNCEEYIEQIKELQKKLEDKDQIIKDLVSMNVAHSVIERQNSIIIEQQNKLKELEER